MEQIKVGTGMTEYGYSDRHPYEVIAVKDQKHITVRAMDHRHVGDGIMDNKWELISNENNPSYDMVKRGKYWYWVVTVEADILKDESLEALLFLTHNGIDADRLREKGKITKYHRAEVSFGKARYYFDYEF